jgi:hypothetical protein
MEDDKSTEVSAPAETPAEDPILSTLSDDTNVSTESEASNESESQTDETQDDKVSEAEATSEAEQPKEETDESQSEVDPKEEARRRYEERQQAIAEKRAKIQDQTKDYVDSAADEYDQRLRAMEVQAYTGLIETNENKLISEYERAKVDPNLQIFNQDSPEFNERAYSKAIKDFNAGYIEYDANNNIIGVKGSLLQHLTETAELLQEAAKSGQIQQVRDSRKMKVTADIKPAAPPKEKTTDPILDILKSD